MKTRMAAIVGGALMLAGCGTHPTISAEAAAPAQDGGVMFGSGHRSGTDSDSTSTGQNDNAPVQTEGGVIFGSGH